MAGNPLFNLIRRKPDSQKTKQVPLPINMAGTVDDTLSTKVHNSDSLTEQVNTGWMGNDYPTPTPEYFIEGADPKRLGDIANSHLNDGPTPGRIARPYNNRNLGKLGQNLTGTPDGSIGLLLNISGVSAGGLGDAMYVQHTSVLRPAGKASGSLRTIDDGAQIPGVYLADPTRR